MHKIRWLTSGDVFSLSDPLLHAVSLTGRQVTLELHDEVTGLIPLLLAIVLCPFEFREEEVLVREEELNRRVQKR